MGRRLQRPWRLALPAVRLRELHVVLARGFHLGALRGLLPLLAAEKFVDLGRLVRLNL